MCVQTAETPVCEVITTFVADYPLLVHTVHRGKSVQSPLSRVRPKTADRGQECDAGFRLCILVQETPGCDSHILGLGRNAGGIHF